MKVFIYIYCGMALLITLSACGDDDIITKTVIQTRYSTAYIPFTKYTSVYVPFLRYTTVYQLPIIHLSPPVSAIATDPSGLVSLTTATFDYWFQNDTTTTVIIRFKAVTNDGANHSFRADYSAVDSAGTVIYSSYINGPAPEVFQTSANIDNTKYTQISNWIVTKVTAYP